jgi:hypothetical protein
MNATFLLKLALPDRLGEGVDRQHHDYNVVKPGVGIARPADDVF